MSRLIPLADLEKQAVETGAFDLWLPHPIMGRALFLRLPLDRGWAFEFDPGEAHASRYMIHRDRMWVSEGKARCFALRSDGSRVEINVRVKRWKPRIPGCHWLREPRRSRLFRRWPGAAEEEVIKSRCCRVEREMRISWRTKDARPASKPAANPGGGPGHGESDVELLFFRLRCH